MSLKFVRKSSVSEGLFNVSGCEWFLLLKVLCDTLKSLDVLGPLMGNSSEGVHMF